MAQAITGRPCVIFDEMWPETATQVLLALENMTVVAVVCPPKRLADSAPELVDLIDSDVFDDPVRNAAMRRICSATGFSHSTALGADLVKAADEVRKVPSWPRSWANFSFYSCVPTGMHGPTCTFWANLTASSLEGDLREVWRLLAAGADPNFPSIFHDGVEHV